MSFLTVESGTVSLTDCWIWHSPKSGAYTDARVSGLRDATLDREKLQQEARDELLQEILLLLEGALPSDCYAAAREALMEEYGEE